MSGSCTASLDVFGGGKEKRVQSGFVIADVELR